MNDEDSASPPLEPDGDPERRQDADVAIIGGGPSGLFAAMELADAGMQCILVERGQDLNHRSCPAMKDGVSCLGCRPCSVTSGMGGAGAYSDGKIILSGDVGGDLLDFVSETRFKGLLDTVDRRFLEFGAPDHVFGTDTDANGNLNIPAIFDYDMVDFQVVP